MSNVTGINEEKSEFNFDFSAARMNELFHEVEDLEKDNYSGIKSTLGYIKRNFYQHSRKNQSIGGITFTVNPDQSFTMNGTATQLVSFMTTNFQTIPQGKYLCSGCDGGSSSTYYLRLETAKSSDQTTSGDVLRQTDGEDVPITVDGDYDSIKVNIVVQAGVTVDNVRIAPMIRADYDDDPTYEPYKPSVADQFAEILERLSALESAAGIVGEITEQ